MTGKTIAFAFVLSNLSTLGGCVAAPDEAPATESRQAYHRDRSHEQTMYQRAIARHGVNIIFGRRPSVILPHGRAEQRWARLVLKNKAVSSPGLWFEMPGVGGGSWIDANDQTLSWTLSTLQFRVQVVNSRPDELGFGICRIDFPQTRIARFFPEGIHGDYLCINYQMSGGEAESDGGRNNNGIGIYLPEINTEIWTKREDRTRITIDNNEWELDTFE